MHTLADHHPIAPRVPWTAILLLIGLLAAAAALSLAYPGRRQVPGRHEIAVAPPIVAPTRPADATTSKSDLAQLSRDSRGRADSAPSNLVPVQPSVDGAHRRTRTHAVTLRSRSHTLVARPRAAVTQRPGADDLAADAAAAGLTTRIDRQP